MYFVMCSCILVVFGHIACPEPRVGMAPWIIAIGIFIPFLVLGLLALILFKVLLFTYVSFGAT